MIPEIVIVEVMLSNGNGFETCRKIKEINSKIKVLIVTKHQHAVDHARASEVGADAHTVKTKSNKFLIDSFKSIVSK